MNSSENCVAIAAHILRCFDSRQGLRTEIRQYFLEAGKQIAKKNDPIRWAKGRGNFGSSPCKAEYDNYPDTGGKWL